MPTVRLTEKQALEAIKAVEDRLAEGRPLDGKASAIRAAAKDLGIPHSTLRSRVAIAKRDFGVIPNLPQEFTIRKPSSPATPIDELVERRKKQFNRKRKHEEERALIPIKIHLPGPIGLVHFGDPHVDDDGTDLAALEHDATVVRNTPGMFGGNVGDTTNNWVGRLARLFADQGTTHEEAWQLAEWFLGLFGGRLLYMIGGNHDCHDPETEALTRRGWLRYEQITDEDEVLSFVPETGACEWSPIQKRIVREHDGELLDIYTRSVSLSVTPNHRVLYRDRDWKREWRGWQYAHADSLPSRVALPVSGRSLNAGADLSDDQIALAGWLLTDGSIYWQGNSPRVTFYQSKDGAEIQRILDTLNLEHRHTVRTRNIEAVCGRELVKTPMDQHEWVLTAGASRKVLAWVPEKGRLPQWAHYLSTAQFSVLLDSIVAGDGTWDGADADAKNVAVVHGAEEFLSSLQAVAVQHGWYSRLSVTRGKDYRLNLCRRDTIQFETKPATTRRRYKGTVWCLTVPHSNFMVRRNGAAHFSGNCWSGAGDQLTWISRHSQGIYQSSEVRMELQFPNGRSVRINAHHDFSGSSQWNPAHGSMKAAQMGFRDHILINGHKHVSGYGLVKDPANGVVSHCIQVASYKIYDRYARERGFRDQFISPSVVTVINPDARDERGLVQVFWDVDEAADFLTHKRAKLRG